MKTSIRLVLMLCCLLGNLMIVGTAQAASYSDAVAQLNNAAFQKKKSAIQALGELGDERAIQVLQALKERQLYAEKYNKKQLYIAQSDSVYLDAVTLQVVDTGTKQLSQIRVNNTLKNIVDGALAQLQLSSSDKVIRLSAVEEMAQHASLDNLTVLQKAFDKENDATIKQQLLKAIALSQLQSDDSAVRLSALVTLSEHLARDLKGALLPLVEQNSAGEYLESDARVRAQAHAMLDRIQSQESFWGFWQNVTFGISLGSVLLLAAIGLAITFGVMGIINMAHGEMIMLGAYTTYALQQAFPSLMEVSLLLAIPCAFLVSGAVGVLIERVVIRHLYGRPLDTLLATFGVSLILQQVVRNIFGTTNMPVESPSWMSGSIELNSFFSMTTGRLYIIVFGLMVMVAIVIALKKTQFGLEMRAVTQNRRMASAMGIRTGWVDALTFGLGSGIAGIAGVALSQLTNVGPNMGQQYIIDSFMVVVFGGVGNLWGTFFGATILGIANKLMEPTFGAVVAKILVLVFIILFIQKKPRGLFAQKGRAAES